MTVNSALPEKDHNALTKIQVAALLSLNDVLKESLKKAQAAVENMQLIVRCENLPLVKATHDDMVRLFDDLLSMILHHPPDASRLFLYVDCEEENNDVIDMTLPENYRRFSIRFHTNITTHENWRMVNSQALINCRQILSKHNGTLAVNDISSAGCLFSVLLPGKIE